MNELNTDKQALLDLLVDGEIDEAQRRELLAWCEREPDGWRRCALAFLEAQSWSKVLGDITDERASQRGEFSPAAPAVSHPQSFWNRRNWGTMLAMAASVVLAFTLGLQLRDAERAGEMSAPQPSLRVVDSQARTTRTATLSGQPEQGPASARLVGAGQVPDEIQVPVVAGDQFGGVSAGSGWTGGGWLLSQPSGLPDDVRRTLERMGHRVEQQRRLVPYRLGDGRRVVVPVDQVEVRPVGDESYQ